MDFDGIRVDLVREEDIESSMRFGYVSSNHWSIDPLRRELVEKVIN